MSGIIFSMFIFYLSLYSAHQDKAAHVETSEPDELFDLIVFAQEWPVTICKYWINDLNGTECVYPNEKNRWITHGIWPTAVGCNLHCPRFCNSSTFDPEQIQSIEGELEQAWTNIFKGTDQYIYWGHEWTKHGSCASELEPFSSQIKYFRKGIEWNQKYSIIDMFNAASIFPDDNKELTVEELAAAVSAKTGKNPTVRCHTMDGLQYVKEMRICFDKQLNLIDCDSKAYYTNCDISKGIILPANA